MYLFFFFLILNHTIKCIAYIMRNVIRYIDTYREYLMTFYAEFLKVFCNDETELHTIVPDTGYT